MFRGSDDAALVSRSIRGDERVFRRLVERHTPLVYAVVRSTLGASAEIEDTVQEVFIKAYRGLPSYRGESRFSTWLFRIAKNHALNVRGRRAPSHEPIDETHEVAAPGDGPAERYRRERVRARVDELIGCLDERYRIALELRYLGEKSYAEIAAILNIPVGTVKTNIHRAKASLKRMLDESRGNESEEECEAL